METTAERPRTRSNFTKEELDHWFGKLASLLEHTPLKREGEIELRRATADEFMLMHRTEGAGYGECVVGFKHRDTRNYLFILHTGLGDCELYVPQKDEPFMRGRF